MRHVAAAGRAGFDAQEETLTEILLTGLGVQAQVRMFTRREESRFTGADWFWWWTDGHEWFGSLVQAKRLKSSAGKYGFEYKPRATRSNPKPIPQVDRLLEAARLLGVPAVYSLYSAGNLPSGSVGQCTEWPGYETPRSRLQVSYLPALIASHARNAKAADILSSAAPIECLACPGRSRTISPFVANLAEDGDLLAFLRAAEHGLPRRVAKALLEPIVELRLGHFRELALEPLDQAEVLNDLEVPGSRVFRSVPLDQGHYAEPYLEHVLRGLRNEPPRYLDALLDGVPPEEFGAAFQDVRGVILVSGE